MKCSTKTFYEKFSAGGSAPSISTSGRRPLDVVVVGCCLEKPWNQKNIYAQYVFETMIAIQSMSLFYSEGGRFMGSFCLLELLKQNSSFFFFFFMRKLRSFVGSNHLFVALFFSGFEYHPSPTFNIMKSRTWFHFEISSPSLRNQNVVFVAMFSFVVVIAAVKRVEFSVG